MKKLSERSKIWLLEGSRVTGTMTEGLEYVIEELYMNEIDTLRAFCEWVDTNIGGCSRYNIDMLFNAFINPNDVYAQKQANALAEQIRKINAMMQR